MKKCLWVVPKLIFPVSDGARVANQSLLRSIRPHFERLDIIVYREEDEKDLHLDQYQENFRPDQIHILPKPKTKGKLRKFLALTYNFLKDPSLPVTAGHFSTSFCQREIRRILQDHEYDLLVFDGLHPFSAFLQLDKEGLLPAFVYRAHNVEQDLWMTAARKTNNPLKRLLLIWQGHKMACLEKMIINKAKRVWAIATEDSKRFSELTGRKDIDHVPVGLNFVREKVFVPSPVRSQKIKLLFVGKLDWAPNKDGLRWFLHEVWPFVNHQKLELKIVGGGEASWTEPFYCYPGIRFLGYVKDLEELYADCDYSIIPIRFGSGTRIKVIESISKGVPVISTPMGVQGSGLEDHEYIKATDAAEWIRALNQLEPEASREKARLAFDKFEQTYSPEMIGQNAYLSLQEV